jgi:hypothetical protein
MREFRDELYVHRKLLVVKTQQPVEKVGNRLVGSLKQDQNT